MKSPLIATLIALIGYGPPAFAQNIDYEPKIRSSCLDGTGEADCATCIGQVVDACIQTDAGSSTVGIGMCISSEWQQLDDRLNAAYQDIQRGWIVYRDTACDWEMVQWGGGTGGGPASVACMMRLTAQQTLFLENHL
ncbi:putative DUF1311 family protein [Octadecabacter antarcticus 307]|uniref:Putative DUF1311 family protein n=1 Tax=Octadecabacter antarcticus 307 TaxID=391626 RepID=M9RD08_9RHOB|nr:lysozyme inhibitor LprI family protein [Octadecabacter antarcticus]AGI67720.1 putative DUF1311 family protein [Octadecabacter antarcticus 307]